MKRIHILLGDRVAVGELPGGYRYRRLLDICCRWLLIVCRYNSDLNCEKLKLINVHQNLLPVAAERTTLT